MAARAFGVTPGGSPSPVPAPRPARYAVAGPVLLVAITLILFVGGRLSGYHDNVTGFIEFGQKFALRTHPPGGALVGSPFGYDGQYFWIQAQDPLLLKQRTLTALGPTAFRSQRVAYPALAFLLAAGQENAIPWTLLAINLVAVVTITAAFALYARRQGWSGWWALAVGLTPGFLLATMRDLSDPLAVATMFGGLLAWRGGRRWTAAGLMTVAVLAREPMVLGVVAVGLDALAGWWRERSRPGVLAQTARRAWPVVVIPAIAFLGWDLYIRTRFGSGVLQSSPGIQPPLVNIVDEVRRSVHGDSSGAQVWDVAYLALVLAGLVSAVGLAVRRITAAVLAALLFGVLFTVLDLGDQWGVSRFGAPLFVTLLLAGLERRARSALVIPALAAGLILLIPSALGGG